MEYTNNEKFSKPDKNDLYSLALWNENTEKTDAALAIAGKPDEYSASKTYAVGDKCIYENALYKCITAISTAEAWTAGHWAKTSLCAEDTANKAAIKELTENSKHIDNTCYSKRLGEHNVTDLLYVDLVNPNGEVNKTVYFGSENPGKELVNTPYTESAFYGYREVRWNGHPGNQIHLITVELHEQYPVAGRIWANTYNKDASKWMGWKCLEP